MAFLHGHFTWVAPPRIGEVVHPRLGSVARRDLTTDSAAQLWRKGFELLHITAEGAAHHFGHLPPAGRAPLLEACKTDEERAIIIALGKPARAPKAPAPADDTPATRPDEQPARPRSRSRRGNDTPEGETPAE